jgi:hypothetical protein
VLIRPRRSGKQSLLRCFMLNTMFYQGGLGTNIGKALKNSVAFLQPALPRARDGARPDRGGEDVALRSPTCDPDPSGAASVGGGEVGSIALPRVVWKRSFCAVLILKTECLPRQARDKHRKS